MQRRPLGEDAKGYVSKLRADGSVEVRRWVTGLNRPKGSVVIGDNLWVADIDVLTAIDTSTGTVRKSYPVPGATFLNDVAVGPEGQLFISDTAGNAILSFRAGVAREWLRGSGLNGPNGLAIIGGELVVGELGRSAQGMSKLSEDDLKPRRAAETGTVVKIDLKTKAVSAFGDGAPIGSVDGIAPTGTGGVYVTDFGGGRLLEVLPGRAAVPIASLPAGAADVDFTPATGVFIIVAMNEGELVAGRRR